MNNFAMMQGFAGKQKGFACFAQNRADGNTATPSVGIAPFLVHLKSIKSFSRLHPLP